MEWYFYLISGGVVLVLGALTFLYFKFAKGTAVDPYFMAASKVMEAVAAFLPDDTAKLDAHDVVLVVGRLVEKIPEWAKDPTNPTWGDCREEVFAFIEEQRTVIPQLAQLPKEEIEKIGEVLFKVAVVFVK